MMDKKKIRLMTRTAIYDKKFGRKDLKIAGYYRKDYVSLNVWISAIWLTIGYLLFASLILLSWGDSIVEGITFLKLLVIIVVAAAVYLSILIAYGIGISSYYKGRYNHAKRRVKWYMRNLSRIEKMNLKKEND